MHCDTMCATKTADGLRDEVDLADPGYPRLPAADHPGERATAESPKPSPRGESTPSFESRAAVFAAEQS